MIRAVSKEDFELIEKELEKSQKEKHFTRKEKVCGQFFTPFEVANFIVDFALSSFGKKPKLSIDPACGDGVFLKALIEKGIDYPVGVDIDEEVLNSIPEETKRKSIVFKKDGLQFLGDEFEGKADIVVGNPPFSAKYGRITDNEILSRFELGKGRKSQAIEILFLERFIQLASDSGVIGIILPSGIFSNLPLNYVREFIFKNTLILGIVSLPRGIFKGTSSKTYVLFAKKQKGEKPTTVFMGIANSKQDLPLILTSYRKRKEYVEPLTFWINPQEALYPEYYAFSKYVPTNGEKLGSLISEMFCGKTEYGTKRRFTKEGIRFISAKNITPLGLDFDKDERKFIEPTSEKVHVKEGDLLFVRVGVGCIGRTAVVIKSEERGVVDDWIYVIRLKNRELAYYLAFYFQSKYGISQINMLRRGVGTVTIPQRLLKELKVLLPTDNQIKIFKELYLKMVELREKNEEEAKKLYKKAIDMIEGNM